MGLRLSSSLIHYSEDPTVLAVVAVLTLDFDHGPGENSAHLLEISITGHLTLGANGTTACLAMWHLSPQPMTFQGPKENLKRYLKGRQLQRPTTSKG
jgi:hypothetical protein